METNVKKVSPDHDTSQNEVSFSQVTAVVTDWMLDFLFLSLCRNFKDGNIDEFNKNMSSLEAISYNAPQHTKVLICAFLGRVMHGKQLDVYFEEDCKAMPLMSAAKIWSDLKKSVEDKDLAKNMTILLFVQSVAVCLENGSDASFVIQWFEENLDCPSALRKKLQTVVSQKDNYHPFITSFSYSRLLETTKAFLDTFLQNNPCDYLLKAGTKAVQSSEKRDTVKDTGQKDDTQTSLESTKVNKVSKRKLLSTKVSDLWAPESCKKPLVCLKRITNNEGPKRDVNDTTKNNKKLRKPRTKWLKEEDNRLLSGVRRHGLGRWSQILLDYDFGDRTGTMLKDRWRILKKSHIV